MHTSKEIDEMAQDAGLEGEPSAQEWGEVNVLIERLCGADWERVNLGAIYPLVPLWLWWNRIQGLRRMDRMLGLSEGESPITRRTVRVFGQLLAATKGMPRDVRRRITIEKLGNEHEISLSLDDLHGHC